MHARAQSGGSRHVCASLIPQLVPPEVPNRRRPFAARRLVLRKPGQNAIARSMDGDRTSHDASHCVELCATARRGRFRRVKGNDIAALSWRLPLAPHDSRHSAQCPTTPTPSDSGSETKLLRVMQCSSLRRYLQFTGRCHDSGRRFPEGNIPWRSGNCATLVRLV